MGIFSFFKRKKTPKSVGQVEKSKIKAGIAFGSGGTRGFAHLGVLKAFEDEGISFDYVAGTSAGSIVGALYSAGYTVSQMVELLSDLSVKDVKGTNLIFMPTKSDYIEKVIERFSGQLQFSDLKKKFACVAVDLISGEEIVLKEGFVAKAVSASCAVPPFYRPVVYNDMHLIDGAYANPIPANVARGLGADVVISVEVNSNRKGGTDSLHILDVYRAATRIATSKTAEEGIKNSDVLIMPNLKEFKAYNIDSVNVMIQKGYDAAYEKMEQIKTLLEIENPTQNCKKCPPTIKFRKIK